MKHTVVYFTDTTGFGGAEQALLTLMAGLNHEEWRPVLMYHPAPSVVPLIEQAQALGVELWPVPRMPDGREGASRVLQFAREVRARRPAVFHAHLTWPLACKFGLVGAILARVPAVVATVHLYLEFPVDLSILAQQRLLIAKAGRYIAVSHATAQRLTQKLHWPISKVQVIHNGMVCRSLADRSTSLAHNQRASGERPLVLTVARLDEQKGHQYLLEAATHLPEAQFVFAGDGPLRSTLEVQTRSLGLDERVTFLGYRTDIADLLAACDVFVLPSLYEGLPLSVLEAMAAGKPVVATRVGGTAEAVLDGESGLLVPPADPIALTAAIRSVVNDHALAQRLASVAQQRVEQEFSTENMINQTTAVYAELLARRGVTHERG
jgi:glycosyltransferase involved in cell wall biosynthesis